MSGSGDRVHIKVLGSMFDASAPTLRMASRYEFTYDRTCDAYDWLVVFDELPTDSEVLRCPKERTILCTWEPVSIKSYSRAYTRQFGHLLTNRPPEAERHPHYHLGRGYFIWFVHDIPKTGEAADKPLAVSAVCSAKQMRHTQHLSRFRLVSELAKEVPGLDWYGKGVRPLARKEDALLPYKYHVAVENHIGVHHWTEKFADAILCECLPFYAGDPALTEIFPAECFIPIPIDDPAEAARIMKSAIAADEYAKRREAVLEAKRLILEKYSFWRQVIAVIESAAAAGGQSERADNPTSSFGSLPLSPFNQPPATSHQSPVTSPPSLLYARKALRRRNLAAALEDGWGHLRRRLGYLI